MTTPTPETPAPNQGQPPAELVEYKNRLESENKDLRKQLTGTHLAGIGLDPGKGLGKAIAQTYKGDISAEAIAAFARDEYGHEFATPAPEQPATVQQAAAMQVAAAAVESVGQPLAPPTQRDQLAAHDQRMADPEATSSDAKAAISDKVGVLLDRITPQ